MANIGKEVINLYESHAVGASIGYTGCSFTVPKRCIVRISLYYTYSAPSEIALCGSASGNQVVLAHASAVSGITNVSISCTAIVGQGTYYVWAKSGSSANNNVAVVAYQIEP